jgi:hypothetical protein
MPINYLNCIAKYSPICDSQNFLYLVNNLVLFKVNMELPVVR